MDRLNVVTTIYEGVLEQQFLFPNVESGEQKYRELVEEAFGDPGNMPVYDYGVEFAVADASTGLAVVDSFVRWGEGFAEAKGMVIPPDFEAAA
jgi:hypothetical protein